MGFTPNNAGVGTSVSIGEIEAATLVTESETISSNDNDTTVPTSAAVKNYADAETATLTNKTFDANGTGNSLSNVEVADLASGVLDTDLASVSASDDTIPSAKATKTALDLKAPLASPTFTGTVTVPVGLTGVLRADTGVVSVDSDVTDIVSAASDSAAGKVELAIASEVTTGTDTGRAVTPDALAGSTAFGRKCVSLQVTAFDGDVATGDGQALFVVPEALNGMNLVRAQAVVYTAGTTNATTVMIRNKTDTADMLSGAISIASGGTVGTVGTINGTTDDVATNDVIAVDVDSVSTTAPQGLVVILEFQLP